MKTEYKIYNFLWKSQKVNNCNTYFIDGPAKILIDPGHKQHFNHAHNKITDLGYQLTDIDLVICTHAHPDHIEAVSLFKKPTLIGFHESEWKLIKKYGKLIKNSTGIDYKSFMPNLFLQEGDLNVKGLNIKVFCTPGHSPGSIVLYLEELKILFSGDLIFNGGLGRTDIPGGDGDLIKKSIMRLSKFDIELLLPGHGDVITGKENIENNFKQLESYWFKFV